jgi:hypothetical protein
MRRAISRLASTHGREGKRTDGRNAPASHFARSETSAGRYRTSAATRTPGPARFDGEGHGVTIHGQHTSAPAHRKGEEGRTSQLAAHPAGGWTAHPAGRRGGVHRCCLNIAVPPRCGNGELSPGPGRRRFRNRYLRGHLRRCSWQAGWHEHTTPDGAPAAVSISCPAWVSTTPTSARMRAGLPDAGLDPHHLN